MGWLKRRIIEELEPTMAEWERRWIPVDEALPEEGVPVLAFCPMIETQVAHLTEEGAWYWGTSGCLGYPATHWMPLPAPPADGK